MLFFFFFPFSAPPWDGAHGTCHPCHPLTTPLLIINKGLLIYIRLMIIRENLRKIVVILQTTCIEFLSSILIFLSSLCKNKGLLVWSYMGFKRVQPKVYTRTSRISMSMSPVLHMASAMLAEISLFFSRNLL